MNDNERVVDDTDPATEAFSRLEREMALMRRAVEHLAAEKADITIPDYTVTLGQISQHLGAAHQTLDVIAAKPAMELTPESLAQRVDYAARQARQTDHHELHRAQERYDYASRELNGVVATIRAVDEQVRHLWWAAGGGLLAGCLLWAILPGVLLRALPDSWHGPEMMAAHIVGEQSMWEAGERLMRAGNPERWRGIVGAAEMRRNNLETIRDCEQRAADANEPVRCTIKVETRVIPAVGTNRRASLHRRHPSVSASSAGSIEIA